MIHRTPIARIVPQLPAPVVESTPPCPVCKGMGYLRQNVPLGHPNFGKRIPCSCKERELARVGKSKAYTWLGSPEDDLGQKSFASFLVREQYQKEALQIAQGFLGMLLTPGQNAPNLLFQGSVGTGKTHLMAAIVNAARNAGVSCRFATATEFFNAYYARDFDEKEALEDEAAEAGLLCLDDLDKLYIKPERDSRVEPGAYQKSVLFNLLNRRYRTRKPTLVSTNALKGLEKWLDEATIDRLVNRGLTIRMIGESQRRAGL